MPVALLQAWPSFFKWPIAEVEIQHGPVVTIIAFICAHIQHCMPLKITVCHVSLQITDNSNLQVDGASCSTVLLSSRLLDGMCPMRGTQPGRSKVNSLCEMQVAFSSNHTCHTAALQH